MSDEQVLYPVWRYHADLPARIVQTPEEDKALGKGWVDSPAKLAAPAAVPDPPAVEDDAAPDVEPDAKPTRRPSRRS